MDAAAYGLALADLVIMRRTRQLFVPARTW